MKQHYLLLLLLLIGCSQDSAPQFPCEAIANGSPHAPPIIFIGDDANETVFDADIAFSQAFIAASPALSSAQFPIYKIHSNDSTICYRDVQDSIVPYLRCDKQRFIELVASCNTERFYTVVITREPIVSHSSVVMGQNSGAFINQDHFTPHTFLHEFGHMLGLRDEYAADVRISGNAGKAGPNCLPESEAFAKWGNATKGCAGREELFRPPFDGAMGKRFSDQYGSDNEEYLQSVTNCCFRENRTKYSCEAFFASYPEWASCRG